MSTQKQWYRIQNLATGMTDVSIFDEIGLFGVTAQDFLADISGIHGPINLHLNSGGGEVFEGIGIYSALKQRGGVSVTIDGLAASIASVIAMAADPGKLSIAKRASMMIHDGFAQAVGNAAEMRQMADLLEQQSQNIAEIYSDRTGKPADYWRTQMKTESWYVGQQAVDAGLADQVVDGATGFQAAATVAPTARLAARTVIVVNADGGHAPMTGTHSHSHDGVSAHEHTHDGDASHSAAQAVPSPTDRARALLLANGFSETETAGLLVAEGGSGGDNGWVDRDGKWVFDPDGDGDDDATPQGDTDHDYFGADGAPVPGKKIPPKPDRAPTSSAAATTDASAITIYNDGSSVDNSAWDASKAWHAGANSDDPGKFYAAICAGRRSGEPDKQSSWALPFKYSPSSPPNAAGVRAALARLGSTEGLTNSDQAKSLLEGLMKKINPDHEPSNVDTSVLSSLFVLALEGAR
jgi:ATP-dependent protease ClpP protease subunit